ncbi:hypothetical protein KIPB_005368, partial [Kipferlia bialata]
TSCCSEEEAGVNEHIPPAHRAEYTRRETLYKKRTAALVSCLKDLQEQRDEQERRYQMSKDKLEGSREIATQSGRCLAVAVISLADRTAELARVDQAMMDIESQYSPSHVGSHAYALAKIVRDRCEGILAASKDHLAKASDHAEEVILLEDRGFSQLTKYRQYIFAVDTFMSDAEMELKRIREDVFADLAREYMSQAGQKRQLEWRPDCPQPPKKRRPPTENPQDEGDLLGRSSGSFLDGYMAAMRAGEVVAIRPHFGGFVFWVKEHNSMSQVSAAVERRWREVLVGRELLSIRLSAGRDCRVTYQFLWDAIEAYEYVSSPRRAQMEYDITERPDYMKGLFSAKINVMDATPFLYDGTMTMDTGDVGKWMASVAQPRESGVGHLPLFQHSQGMRGGSMSTVERKVPTDILDLLCYAAGVAVGETLDDYCHLVYSSEEETGIIDFLSQWLGGPALHVIDGAFGCAPLPRLLIRRSEESQCISKDTLDQWKTFGIPILVLKRAPSQTEKRPSERRGNGIIGVALEELQRYRLERGDEGLATSLLWNHRDRQHMHHRHVGVDYTTSRLRHQACDPREEIHDGLLTQMAAGKREEDSALAERNVMDRDAADVMLVMPESVTDVTCQRDKPQRQRESAEISSNDLRSMIDDLGVQLEERQKRWMSDAAERERLQASVTQLQHDLTEERDASTELSRVVASVTEERDTLAEEVQDLRVQAEGYQRHEGSSIYSESHLGERGRETPR